MELSEFDIQLLHMDGSSSSYGCGAGVVIISLEDIEVSYVLRFEFEAFNNEMEYEVLIAKLKNSQKLRCKKAKNQE